MTSPVLGVPLWLQVPRSPPTADPRGSYTCTDHVVGIVVAVTPDNKAVPLVSVTGTLPRAGGIVGVTELVTVCEAVIEAVFE